MSEALSHGLCPCCGQNWGEVGPKADARRVLFPLTKRIPGQRAFLLNYLLAHFGEWSLRKKLVDALYADDVHGGPDGSENVIAVQLTRLRQHLAPFGYGIESRAHCGSRLRLFSKEDMSCGTSGSNPSGTGPSR